MFTNRRAIGVGTEARSLKHVGPIDVRMRSIFQMRPQMRSIVWFKGNDLRINDNPSLFHAATKSTSVTALFILSPVEEASHNRSAIQMDYLLRSLADLSASLWTKHKIPMLVKTAESASGVFDIMRETCTKLDVKKVYFNNQYELDESRRDNKMQKLLVASGVSVSRFDSDVVVKPSSLVSKDGRSIQVFTPFKKSWFEHVKAHPYLLKEFAVPTEWKNEEAGTQLPDKVPTSLAGFELSDARRAKMMELYPAGEDHAGELLKAFAKNKLTNYQRDRDFLAVESTSKVSPLLAIGIFLP
jgi:deoxyribodipyrimidine photo-lyase